jgi:hypothetical protein
LAPRKGWKSAEAVVSVYEKEGVVAEVDEGDSEEVVLQTAPQEAN